MEIKQLILVAGVAASLGLSSAAYARDRDHDKMNDRWERLHGLRVGRNDAKHDPDRDHLFNVQEYRHKTDPHDSDSDDDLLLDGEEVRKFRTSPRLEDSNSDGIRDCDEDYDDDGLSNKEDDDDSSSSSSSSSAGSQVDSRNGADKPEDDLAGGSSSSSSSAGSEVEDHHRGGRH